jgi:hypothetical protein
MCWGRRKKRTWFPSSVKWYWTVKPISTEGMERMTVSWRSKGNPGRHVPCGLNFQHPQLYPMWKMKDDQCSEWNISWCIADLTPGQMRMPLCNSSNQRLCSSYDVSCVLLKFPITFLVDTIIVPF